MSHAVRVLIGERLIHAAMRSGNSAVVDAEVADMQFVDAHIAQAAKRRRSCIVPAGGLCCVGIEISDTAFGSVQRDVDRVGISGDVGVDGGSDGT